LYWPTSNAAPDFLGDSRPGDNLYTASVLALDPDTGAIKWYFQFTPHDLYDYDATETPVLTDVQENGVTKHLLLQANRNGFFYVLDRTNGKFLRATPFVKKLNWAKAIDASGRPILTDRIPTPEGTYICPGIEGATNWFSPSFNPATGLYYVQTFTKCSVYTKRDPGEWESGKAYLGGSQRNASNEKPVAALKAIDLQTGDVKWELPEPGPANSWGGTLATSTGLVFVGEEGGSLMAVDAANGKPLWSFPANQVWKASPMTYMFDGRQYIAVASGANIIAFGITE
jgi:alcohol dehydrogenase (cytochrome c)